MVPTHYMQSPSESEAQTGLNAVPLLDPAHELPAHASPSSDGMPGNNPPAEHKAGGGWIRMVIVSLVILGAIAFVVWRIRSNKTAEQQQAAKSAAQADRPVPVTIDTVGLRSIPIYLTALGTVTAYNTVTLKSRVDGQITGIHFVEGQQVKQGQLLIQIDPAPYQAALAQAQGNLSRDQANAALAKSQANRYTALYNAGVVSRESEQTQQSTAGQSVGTIEGDQAAIQAAKVNLSYTRITAPISGIVGLRQVDLGNMVSASSSTGLLVITQVQPISVIFTVPEDQLPQVFDGMKGGHRLVVEAWDRSNTEKIATGTLLTVDNQIDTTTGTAKLKAVFANDDNALFPNQFVNTRLILETRNNAIVIPAAALQTGTTGNFVYVVDKQHPVQQTPTGTGKTAPAAAATPASQHQQQQAYPVQARPVKVDLTQGSQIILDSGLRPGEAVVIDGQEKLRDGSKVLPHENDTTGARSKSSAKPLGSNPNGSSKTPPQKTHPNGAAQLPNSSTHKKQQNGNGATQP
ncbi:MdtA/MuxA family multidrug efflux RND transporter periplasmic adaptor subunit [Terriglobus saanensis]|nr:MdtA/MuxA family multidrug efflux RND transporter periplasmic adaptor subunit [Terriglobus saanensis]